ncbi:hypothetical protein CRM22_010264, partial [Opisthorchis felineus]
YKITSRIWLNQTYYLASFTECKRTSNVCCSSQLLTLSEATSLFHQKNVSKNRCMDHVSVHATKTPRTLLVGMILSRRFTTGACIIVNIIVMEGVAEVQTCSTILNTVTGVADHLIMKYKSKDSENRLPIFVEGEIRCRAEFWNLSAWMIANIDIVFTGSK